MSNRRNDELGEIIDIISKETKFHKTYLGKVLDVNDESSKGRVRIAIPELGWLTATESPWVDPEYPSRGVCTPDEGDWVSVFFLSGDAARPVYRSRIPVVNNVTPSTYEDHTTRVLYDDGTASVVYNTSSGELDVTGIKTISINNDNTIEINESGIVINSNSNKITIKNSTTSLMTLIGDLLDYISSMSTFGSPAVHTVTAASKAQFTALKTEYESLLEE